jgi:glycosyltransferase involved in cell wall biosynthesis
MPMSCRIIYFHRLEFTVSGQTIQVLRDYHALLSHGHEVHLFYRAPQRLSDSELNAWMMRHGLAPAARFQVHYIEEGVAGKQRLYRAVRALMAESADPVLIAVRTVDHAARALRLRRQEGRERVKVLIELHETALPHMIYRDQGRRVRAWLSRRTERRVLREVDGIIATVGSQLPRLDEAFPVHARTIVLPNGVDLAAFAATHGIVKYADGVFRLRYAGQFTAWKNTDIMIESLTRLPQHVVLELAGGKPGAEARTRAAIEALAQRFGVEGRVRYVGLLSPVEVPAFLRQADALLLPLGDNIQSRHFTSPMKLFEYAASGVPMIVTRQPTTLSLVRDGQEAMMVSPGSADELARAVAALMESPEMARILARQAREWVQQYSYPLRAARYHAFIGTLLTTRGSPVSHRAD